MSIKKLNKLLDNGVASVDEMVTRISPKVPFAIPEYGGVFGGAQGIADVASGLLGHSGSGGGANFGGAYPGDVFVNGERGSWGGRTNGGRPTYRFSKPWNGYGPNAQLKWYDGKTYTVPNKANDPRDGSRYEYNIGPFLWKGISDGDKNLVILGRQGDTGIGNANAGGSAPTGTFAVPSNSSSNLYFSHWAPTSVFGSSALVLGPGLHLKWLRLNGQPMQRHCTSCDKGREVWKGGRSASGTLTCEDTSGTKYRQVVGPGGEVGRRMAGPAWRR